MNRPELSKAAEKLVLGNRAADIDTCLETGMDFDADELVFSDISEAS